MRRGLAAVIVLSLASPAAAEELVYVEALGKAGAYGVGYERTMTGRLALGAAASFVSLSDQQVYTASTYLHARVAGAARHRLFGELGAILAHSRIPSPVPDWDGMSDTGGGGYLSVGYEHQRGRFVFRASAAVVAGEGGLGPMLGLLVGIKP